MPKKRWKLKASEDDHCQAFWEAAQLHPILKKYLIRIENAAKRSYSLSNRLKAQGFRAGTPDYCLAYSNKNWGSLWIEMKRDGKAIRRPEQKARIETLREGGQYAAFCHSWEEAYELALNYISDKI
jgi:VRR-NUC domain